MKKKLAVFLTLATVMAVCFTVSDYSWASSTSSESYMATSVKKIHTDAPIVYELKSKEGDIMCYTCGAWEHFCFKNGIAFHR